MKSIILFLLNDNYEYLSEDPTKQYTTSLNAHIKKSKNVLDDETRRRIKLMKLSAAKFTGLPKIHKQDIAIRPLVHFTTAPGFKTAKILYKIIRPCIHLKQP